MLHQPNQCGHFPSLTTIQQQQCRIGSLMREMEANAVRLALTRLMDHRDGHQVQVRSYKGCQKSYCFPIRYSNNSRSIASFKKHSSFIFPPFFLFSILVVVVVRICLARLKSRIVLVVIPRNFFLVYISGVGSLIVVSLGS